MAGIAYETVVGEKGKPIIIVEGAKFRRQKQLANNVVRWTCSTHKTCKCFLKIDENGTCLSDCLLIHNHKKDNIQKLDRQKISNSIKRKAIDDPSVRPSKLLQTELQKSGSLNLTIQDVTLIRKNVGYTRLAHLPKLPKTFSEFHNALNDMTLQTNENETFLLHNDSDNNIVCFSTDTNIKKLTECSKVTADGTFYSCPNPFLQVFCIHGLANNVFIPLMFFLLPNKLQTSYERAFSFLLEKIKSLNLNFAPDSIRVDFEPAIHAAIKKMFPHIPVFGCRFHLGQSWWRKIQSLGLSTEYRKFDSSISIFLRSLFGLPFLPPNAVSDSFVFDFVSIKPNDARVTKFCDYLLDTYISESALFPPSIWAEYSPCVSRTTNNCESFHSKFNSYFYTSKPNIFQFTEAVKAVQTEIYIKMRSTLPKSKITLEREQFLNDKMMLWKSRNIDRHQFVCQVSSKFLPAYFKSKK